ncbi:MAG: hypothetical protein EBX19_08560, partial [Actinobacteria bacterium]|nr:hypothetical protein [Actinomycetota bacterium]
MWVAFPIPTPSAFRSVPDLPLRSPPQGLAPVASPSVKALRSTSTPIPGQGSPTNGTSTAMPSTEPQPLLIPPTPQALTP